MNTDNTSSLQEADPIDEIKALREAYRLLKEENEILKMQIHHWISVNDLLPMENQEVLCFNLFGRIMQKSWMQYTDQDAEWFKKNFTHWQQLPNEPS